MFTSDVDLALLGKLSADAQLKTLMPDGCYWDISPSGKTRIVIVKLMGHDLTDMFGGEAFEQPLYLVKAVELSTSAANVINAAKRIDQLLNNQALTISGYSLMTLQYQEYIRYAEADSTNPDARWQHCGGMYLISVSPN